jgi:hypothetical protein
MEWTYLIDNKSDEQKTIVVEHARYPDWKLADPAKADETTDAVYRFERKLGPGKVLKLPVRTEMARPEEVQILPLDPAKLEVFVKLDKLPEKVRDALTQVIEMKQAVAATELQIRQRDQRILDVTNEQSRIRENMKTVSQSTDYYARLIKKLDEQETQIETMQKDVGGLQKQLESQRKELETKVGQLTID